MLQHEVSRNQDLFGQLKRLEERETVAAKNLSGQMEANCSLRKNLDSLNKALLERDMKLSSVNQVDTQTHIHINLPSFSFSFILSVSALLLVH